MGVTVRIIDYRSLRRSYIQWRLAHPAILEWYRRWTSHWRPITQQ